jgi:ribulose-bisphosphate carboxylase large chain
MKLSDQKAFQAELSTLDTEKYLLLDYYFETIGDPLETAAHLCQEMSTAQWHRIGIDEDFRPEFGARIVDLANIHELEQPSSPHLAHLLGWQQGSVKACNVSIAYPYHNFGTRIPNLLTVIFGEGVFHAPFICAIRLNDIHFPASFLQDFQGPQFGISGLREILDIQDRPFYFGVIKPNVGLSPELFGEIAYQAWLGGLDIAKDDEQIGNAAWSTLEERTRILGALRYNAEKVTGKKKIYLANITDEVDQLRHNHDIAVKNGANAVLINTMTVGMSTVRALRKYATVPIISHFHAYGAMTQIPFHGVREEVFTKLLRMAGADAVVYPGFEPRMKSPRETVIATVNACLSDFGGFKKTLPLPAGSQWAGSLLELYETLGTIDFGIVAGRGVFSHPMGPEGGARSLHQGWEAVQKGISLEEFGRDHEELRMAMEANRK